MPMTDPRNYTFRLSHVALIAAPPAVFAAVAFISWLLQ